jgi:hypothetical protein
VPAQFGPSVLPNTTGIGGTKRAFSHSLDHKLDRRGGRRRRPRGHRGVGRCRHSWGRSVKGARVMGRSELESIIIEEFAVHGVQVDRMVAGQTAFRKDVHTVV